MGCQVGDAQKQPPKRWGLAWACLRGASGHLFAANIARICWEFALADFTERYNSKSGSSSRQESTLRQPEWVKSVCS